MKKFKLLFIGCAIICGVSTLAFNNYSRINNEYNDTNNIIEHHATVKCSNLRNTKDSSYLAIVSIYAFDGNSASSSSSFLNFSGHAFITVENLTSNTIKVGIMNANAYETVTLGTWGNKSDHKGLWYNLESYFANKGEYNGRVSLSRYTTSNELDTLNSYINSHDSWSALSYCSSFSAGAWNSISQDKLSAGLINTPSNLKGNIKKKSYKTNKAIGFNSNIRYYSDDKFIYINLNSKGIFDSNMHNFNSL